MISPGGSQQDPCALFWSPYNSLPARQRLFLCSARQKSKK
ncbi:hypothetical protein BN1221_01610c [Brenneria goodwinii]|uniref:Uncharacterized protein n=1 Tax=Brenneria goodwinii TaxID=1109412 RepID=A0A0G4JTD1_9GAMM|nr:hypothetical protein BN1221_01610c [Brenneria goodwinii]